ncbi:MAG: hypothetical protein NZ780_07330 [Candidatus Poseidoniales archaeon]|nr:hypothetical protein [Candidatus Poseidoniales archaeon]
MNRIAILGSSLEALQQGHMSLDENISAKITIYTEEAEPGFPDVEVFEEAELEKFLRSIPEGWVTSIPNVIGRKEASAVAYSWLCKAMAIRLAQRGAQFQLRTSILSIDDKLQEISFRGGGRLSSGVDCYDELYDYR